LTYQVIFSPEAWAQLAALYDYIADASSEAIADKYISAIIAYCRNLSTFPKRGAQRDDLRPGIRIFGFRRRVSIAFAISETAVTILGIFYGGQNLEALLKEPED
jgi:toxin ParE1/3/4